MYYIRDINLHIHISMYIEIHMYIFLCRYNFPLNFAVSNIFPKLSTYQELVKGFSNYKRSS